MGQHDLARELLGAVAPGLAALAGPDNPISHELNFAIARMAASEEVAAAARGDEGAAERLGSLQQDMQASVTACLPAFKRVCGFCLPGGRAAGRQAPQLPWASLRRQMPA